MSEPTRGTCVVCGCTDLYCTRCVEKTGQRCDWADEARTLCTACVELTPGIITALRAAVEAGKAETARLETERDAAKVLADEWRETHAALAEQWIFVMGERDDSRTERDALRAEVERLRLDSRTVETAMTTTADLSERLEAALADRDALRGEFARLTTRHPASEPPDDDRDVLVVCDDGSRWVDFWDRQHKRWAVVGVSIDAVVAHWQELPPVQEVTP